MFALLAMLVVTVVMAVASVLLNKQNKDDSAKAEGSISQDSVPKANVLDPIGVVFGTVKIKNANTITDGNFHSITQQVSSGGKGGKK